MARPLPIDTVVSKKFEDVITRPQPVTPSGPKIEVQVDERLAAVEPEKQIVVESPRTRRRCKRIFALAGAGAF